MEREWAPQDQDSGTAGLTGSPDTVPITFNWEAALSRGYERGLWCQVESELYQLLALEQEAISELLRDRVMLSEAGLRRWWPGQWWWGWSQVDGAQMYIQRGRNQSDSMNDWLIRPGGGRGERFRSNSKVCGLGNCVEMPCNGIWNPGKEHFKKEMVSSICGSVEFVVPMRLPSVGNQRADG